MKKQILVITMIVFMANAFITDNLANNTSTSTIKELKESNNFKTKNSNQEVIENCTLIANWDENYGLTSSIIINDTLAYILIFNAGLVVLNISNTASPEYVGSSLFDGFGYREFHIKDHYAFIRNSNYGLIVLDISDPRNIITVAKYPGISGTNAFEAHNDTAIIVSTGGFKILNISNPIFPVVLSQTTHSALNHAAFTEEYSFFTSNTIIEIYNITNPLSPDYITEFNDSHNLMDVYVEGDYLYYTSTHALTIMNISDIENPVFVANTTYGSGTREIKKIGDYLYLARSYGVTIIDVSNISSPELTGSYDGDFICFHIDIQEDLAYITKLDFGLEIINVSNPVTPTKIGEFNFGGYTYDVQISENIAFVANYKWLAILNTTDKTNPYQISRYPTQLGRFYSSVDKYEDYVLLGSRLSSFDIVSVSDLENPSYTYHKFGFGFISDMVIKGNLIFLAANYDGLLIYDISNPNIPHKIGSFDNGGSIRKIEVKGNYVYAADFNDGLEVINITDIEEPTLVETYIGKVMDVKITENHIIVADDLSSTIVIRELVNETEFVELSQFTYEGDIYGLFVEEDLVYVANGWNGLKILNWSNPSQPELVGEYREEFIAENICAEDGYIYLSCGLKGLTIIIFDADKNGIPDVLERPEPPPSSTTSPAEIIFPVVLTTLTVNLIAIVIIRRRK